MQLHNYDVVGFGLEFAWIAALLGREQFFASASNQKPKRKQVFTVRPGILQLAGQLVNQCPSKATFGQNVCLTCQIWWWWRLQQPLGQGVAGVAQHHAQMVAAQGNCDARLGWLQTGKGMFGHVVQRFGQHDLQVASNFCAVWW